MVQKGKLTKTEIFSLALTGLFLLVVLTVFAVGQSSREGISVTTWKKTDASETAPQKIDINAADEEQLQLLPGIGPVLAQRIVQWRQENGNYEIPEDLLAVEGIGLATLEAIRDMITIQEAP